MNKQPTLPSALAVAACLALGAAAQAAEEADHLVQLAWAAAAPGAPMALDLDDASLDFALGELGGERVVKGAPYCADAVHESIQTLADGNRIVRQQQTRLCRDGDGRTRQEVERNGRKRIWLRDPVARQAWLLDPARKTARRLGAHGHAMWFNAAHLDPAQADAWRAYADLAREQAREAVEKAREHMRAMRDAMPRPGGAGSAGAAPAAPVAATVATPAAAPVVVTRGAPAADAQGDPHRHVDIQVLRLRPGEAPAAMPMPMPGVPHVAPLPPMPLAPPAIRWQAQHAAPRGPGVVTALGSKDLEGVRANGERTSWTIEAGKIGNEKPIQIVREVWTSPELLLTVLSRDADPRSGETVYRLANVKRGEPDAALMKVPSDYAEAAASTPMPPAAPAAPATPRKPATPPAPAAPKG
jgi:hypothetical protein